MGVAAGALAFYSNACLAAGSDGVGAPRAIPATLADVVVLSNSAMARETGTSLRPATINHDSGDRPTILLWDELKASPQLSSGVGGSANVTVTVGK